MAVVVVVLVVLVACAVVCAVVVRAVDGCLPLPLASPRKSFPLGALAARKSCLGLERPRRRGERRCDQEAAQPHAHVSTVQDTRV